MPMSVQYGAASPLLHCKYRGVYDALSENIVDSSDYSDLSNHCSLYTVQFVQQGAKIWNFMLKMIKMRKVILYKFELYESVKSSVNIFTDLNRGFPTIHHH